MHYVIAMAVLFACAVEAQADLHTETVEYQHDGTLLEGYLAYDEQLEALAPGVLVVHEWKGLGEYAKRRTRELAELGYVAFAIDMYGKGIRAADHTEAAALSGIYRTDRQLMRARAQAGLKVLTAHAQVDPVRIAAIGYCFGGTTVLELARDGAELAAVVSFHGGLDSPTPQDAARIKGRVLVLQGGKDRMTLSDVPGFQAEMTEFGVDWDMITYEGAVHGFTVPEAGDDPSTGIAYHPEADRLSWAAMRKVLEEVF